jgi:hypothetical protein
MPDLASQRCLNHSFREAVARCPECSRYFCRECITEHDDRVICASCLKALALKEARPAKRRINLWPAVQGAGGLLIAFFVFYAIGRVLLAMPDQFHDEKVWKSKFMDYFGMKDDE